MGRLINGSNGPFVGKAGSHIGYVVNGVGYIKGIYKRRTKPPTEKEAFNREKFAVAQRWLQPLLEPIKIGFKGHSNRMHAFAAAKSHLMKNALQVIDGQIVIEPSLVKISLGDYPLPENLLCTFDEPGTFRFSWTPQGGIEGEAQVMAIAYDVEGKMFCADKIYGSTISTGEYKIKVNTSYGGTFLVYAACISADRMRRSDSVFLGKFEF